MCLITDDLFVNLLGVAIGREGFLDRSHLIYRQVLRVGLTIYGAGRRENEVFHPMQTHHFEKGNEAA